MRPESVDPAVADAVAELLLLPPQDLVRQHARERLAQHRLLDPARTVGARAHHLVARIHAHRHVEEFDVEERHPRLHAPGHHRLVGAQAVVLVQRIELARSEEHTSELQSLMRISYAVFCLKKKKNSTELKKEYALCAEHLKIRH